jgi:hypothetical protein
MQILKAAMLYFAVVFGAGFVLGPFRILWVVPRLGTRMAELLEAPVMFVITIVAAVDRSEARCAGYAVESTRHGLHRA